MTSRTLRAGVDPHLQQRERMRVRQKVHAARSGISLFDRAAERLIFRGVSEAPDHPQACPICGKLAVERFRPFCSARCKDVDLNRWFSGAYAIPGEEAEALPDAEELVRARREQEGRG